MRRLALFLLLISPVIAQCQYLVDYSDEKAWAALPWMEDEADKVNIWEYKDNQDTAKVDVFFIHPTSYLTGIAWNADLKNILINERTDQGSIKNQASVFNGSCRVFAPRYRQAVLRSFYPINKRRGEEALEFAYNDIKAAFEYYLEHYNEGRPIIIASHSQGTRHAVRLVKEYFDGKPLQDKLVAAYLIGFPVECNSFDSLNVCEAEGETGCFVSWNTFKWGAKEATREGFYDNACCVNPLSWKADSSFAGRELHKGSVTVTLFDHLDKNEVDAKCEGGKLWVHPPKSVKYVNISKNYHIYDYNFFYGNIRENVATRVKNYLMAQ